MGTGLGVVSECQTNANNTKGPEAVVRVMVRAQFRARVRAEDIRAKTQVISESLH